MGSQTPRVASASAEETRAYIADMVEQLAHMAADLGDHATAETLRQAIACYPAPPNLIAGLHRL